MAPVVGELEELDVLRDIEANRIEAGGRCLTGDLRQVLRGAERLPGNLVEARDVAAADDVVRVGLVVAGERDELLRPAHDRPRCRRARAGRRRRCR
ncbi:MAG: hypothetical protein M5T61_20370 [Acidimicrobiia bacterium]|nr:hypothetical protein [Acidimicrobiia bacterium]